MSTYYSRPLESPHVLIVFIFVCFFLVNSQSEMNKKKLASCCRKVLVGSRLLSPEITTQKLH